MEGDLDGCAVGNFVGLPVGAWSDSQLLVLPLVTQLVKGGRSTIAATAGRNQVIGYDDDGIYERTKHFQYVAVGS